MDESLEKLINMGFTDRELIFRALHRAGNDINEAVTLLTDPNFCNNDITTSNESSTTSTFIGPLTKEQIEQQEQQTVVNEQT